MKFFKVSGVLKPLVKAMPRRRGTNVIHSAHEFVEHVRHMDRARPMAIRSGNPGKYMKALDTNRKIKHDRLINDFTEAGVPIKSRAHAEELAWKLVKEVRKPKQRRIPKSTAPSKISPDLLEAKEPGLTPAMQRALKAGKKYVS